MQLEPVRMIWSKYEESETGNTAVGFGINGPLGVGTCVPGFACRSKFEWEEGCWDGETEFIVKLYCSWVTTPTPLFSTYNTKLRVSPIFQVYHEGENQTLPWLIRTRLNGYLIIKKNNIVCCPWSPLVFVQSMLLWYFSLKFHLKYLYNSKWNCQFFPHFTWFWCETAHFCGSLDHKALCVRLGPSWLNSYANISKFSLELSFMFVMKPELRQILCGFHCEHAGNVRKLCIFLSTLWNDLIFHFSQVSYVNTIAKSLLICSLTFLLAIR